MIEGLYKVVAIIEVSTEYLNDRNTIRENVISALQKKFIEDDRPEAYFVVNKLPRSKAFGKILERILVQDISEDKNLEEMVYL